MFFPERIQSIGDLDLVLEVGPGSRPYPRSDVYLDIHHQDQQTALAQRGFAQSRSLQRPLIHYAGGVFPFKDGAFDYAVCSHVIEHVPPSDLETFLSELGRVARRGYLEFPTVFYELVNYQEVHRWLINYRDGVVLLLDKVRFRSNHIHRIYREMFYGRDRYLYRSFRRYKEFFFRGFEWQGDISYRVVTEYDELVDETDFDIWSSYFAVFQPAVERKSQSLIVLVRVIKQLAQLLLSLMRKPRETLRRVMSRSARGYFVHGTARIERSDLVVINERAEIKDHVIIDTHSNPVVIGRFTQINPFTVIYGGSGVLIGDNVMIAPHCVLAAGNHDFRQVEKPMRFAGSISRGPIIIEDNVWIGAGSIITDGVRIHRDAVVGANSVVTKDVAPFDIVAGAPARVIGHRGDTGYQ